MGAWYVLRSVLEPGTRSTLSDIGLILGFVIALAAGIKILWSWFGKYIAFPFHWFWRRMWGKDNHGVWLVPSVRMERRIQAAVNPKMEEQTSALLAEVIRSRQDANLALGAFRHENAVQHSAVESRLSAVEESQRSMSDRLIAVETALRIVDRE